MAKYNQRQCERIISDRLMEKGYLIYKNSPLPYQIYKIEAFNNEEEKQKGKQLLHFIVDRPGRAAGTPPLPLKVRESPSGGPCR